MEKIIITKQQMAEYLNWCSQGSGSLYQLDFETPDGRVTVIFPRINVAFENTKDD